MLGIATSFVAGLATAPFVAFHFHRLAPYGVLANLLAMPLIAFVIMPAGLIAVLLIPFGFDAPLWIAMGWGIDGMLTIARWVAALPGAEGRVGAFGAGALLLAAAGLLLLTIPVSRLKLAGVPLLAAALVLALNVTRPDIYLDADAEAVAVRGADGKLTIHGANRGRLAALSWLAAEADARTTKDELATGFTCDANGCVAKLADGTIIAVALRPEAFADDCRDAALVVSKSQLPEACAAPGIDRRTLSTTGAISLRRSTASGWRKPRARPTPTGPGTAGRRRPIRRCSIVSRRGSLPLPHRQSSSARAPATCRCPMCRRGRS